MGWEGIEVRLWDRGHIDELGNVKCLSSSFFCVGIVLGCFDEG